MFYKLQFMSNSFIFQLILGKIRNNNATRQRYEESHELMVSASKERKEVEYYTNCHCLQQWTFFLIHQIFYNGLESTRKWFFCKYGGVLEVIRETYGNPLVCETVMRYINLSLFSDILRKRKEKLNRTPNYRKLSKQAVLAFRDLLIIMYFLLSFLVVLKLCSIISFLELITCN